MDPQAAQSKQCPYLGGTIQIKTAAEALPGHTGSLEHGTHNNTYSLYSLTYIYLYI